MIAFNFKYHFIFAILLFFVLWQYAPTYLNGFTLLGVLISFSLPDLDKVNSKPGRKLRLISLIISFFTKHRGFTHSIVAVFVVSYLGLFAAYGINKIEFAYGIFIGYTSHLLADMSTPDGIKLLWPLPIRIRIPILSYSKAISGTFWILLFMYLIVNK